MIYNKLLVQYERTVFYLNIL